jgi:hypothetical protein
MPRDAGVGGILSFGPRVSVPALHVAGEADALVPASTTELLAGHFDGAVIFKHEGGHAVPGNGPFRAAARQFVAPFFAAAQAEPAGDAAAPASAPAVDQAAAAGEVPPACAPGAVNGSPAAD